MKTEEMVVKANKRDFFTAPFTFSSLAQLRLITIIYDLFYCMF